MLVKEKNNIFLLTLSSLFSDNSTARAQSGPLAARSGYRKIRSGNRDYQERNQDRQPRPLCCQRVQLLTHRVWAPCPPKVDNCQTPAIFVSILNNFNRDKKIIKEIQNVRLFNVSIHINLYPNRLKYDGNRRKKAKILESRSPGIPECL